MMAIAKTAVFAILDQPKTDLAENLSIEGKL